MPSNYSGYSGEMEVLQGIQVLLCGFLCWTSNYDFDSDFFCLAVLKLRKNYVEFCLVSIDIYFPLFWDFRHHRGPFFLLYFSVIDGPLEISFYVLFLDVVGSLCNFVCRAVLDQQYSLNSKNFAAKNLFRYTRV